MVFSRKEAAKLMWQVKKRQIPSSWSNEDIQGMANEYFYRLWRDGNAWELDYENEENDTEVLRSNNQQR